MTDSMQDKALQKKLVGAAVLIALAVIFLPMLFDGKKDETPVSMRIEIPPKPTFDIPNRLERGQEAAPGRVAQAPEPPVQTIEIATDEPPAEAAPADRAEAEPPTPAQAVEPPAAPSKPVGQARTEPAAVARPEPKKPAPKKAGKPEPRRPADTPKKPAAGAAGFVVQVGSFSQKANAESLTRKLQAGGFPAFVEGTRAGGKSIYRVKVGPRPTREAADDLRQRLIDKQRLEGIIVSHH